MAVVGLLGSIACDPAAVVDAAASSLAAKATIVDTEAVPSDGKVPIVMQFFANGDLVQLAGSATVSCNGTRFRWSIHP